MSNPNLNENEDKPQTPKETEQEEKPEESPAEGEGVQPDVDYKKKFGESTRNQQEQVQTHKEEMEAKDEEIAKLELTLSDKELKTQNPDFEFMSDEEKAKYKKEQAVSKDVAILKAKEQMRDDYSSLPAEIKTSLEGKGGYDAFRDFACLPNNVGQKDLLNLAKSFLYEPKQAPAPKEPKPGLESGGGGEKFTPPKEEGFTIDEVKEIRLNDPDRYTQLAKAGKLKIIS